MKQIAANMRHHRLEELLRVENEKMEMEQRIRSGKQILFEEKN
jgi:hypothetical protein